MTDTHDNGREEQWRWVMQGYAQKVGVRRTEARVRLLSKNRTHTVVDDLTQEQAARIMDKHNDELAAARAQAGLAKEIAEAYPFSIEWFEDWQSRLDLLTAGPTATT